MAFAPRPRLLITRLTHAGTGNQINTIDGGDCLSYSYYPIRQGSIDVEVRSPNDAHIALTFARKETDPMYEIILGGWGNTASVIRYRQEQPHKVTMLPNTDFTKLFHTNMVPT